MGEEVGDGAAGHGEAGVRGVGIGEDRAFAGDVEAEGDVDVCDLAEFAGIDEGEGALDGIVENVVVIFDDGSVASVCVCEEIL